jgi:hypothetical protein
MNIDAFQGESRGVTCEMVANLTGSGRVAQLRYSAALMSSKVVWTVTLHVRRRSSARARNSGLDVSTGCFLVMECPVSFTVDFPERQSQPRLSPHQVLP